MPSKLSMVLLSPLYEPWREILHYLGGLFVCLFVYVKFNIKKNHSVYINGCELFHFKINKVLIFFFEFEKHIQINNRDTYQFNGRWHSNFGKYIYFTIFVSSYSEYLSFLFKNLGYLRGLPGKVQFWGRKLLTSVAK